jgi:cysteine desulfurase/selenocysteine lyase
MNIRKDFPFFNNEQVLSFFDSAASAQKPQKMLDCLARLYSKQYANIHRGIYDLSSEATTAFEKVRDDVATFINAKSVSEIVFTKNATEAINLVANSYGRSNISECCEILISMIEHHSNIIPWQRICEEKNTKINVIPITKGGQINFDELEKLISSKTKLIAITHMSNVFGVSVDIKKVVALARQVGAKVLVDACQSIAHMTVDVLDLDCDFLVFSSHKLYGPTGVGVLYGKYELLGRMEPYQTGGSMVNEVTFHKTTFLKAPKKFESGTPAVAEVIAFGATLEYLNTLNLPLLWEYERKLANYIRREIKKIDNYKIINDVEDSIIISITHSKAHHSDIGDILNQCQVAIRTGHHCAQPLMAHLGITGTARISLGIYNNMEDAKKLIFALKKVNEIFR